MKHLSFLFLVSIVIFSSCKKEVNPPIKIHPDFQKYVDRFYAEAEKRGTHLSKDNLEVVYEDLSELGFCGYGTFTNTGTVAALVQINGSTECWGNKNDYAKENLIFHELGHAVLERFHLNTLLPNGSPKSMMCGNGECNNFRIYTAYTEATRAYYLDELFDEETPIPKWANKKKVFDNYYFENFDSILITENNWIPYISDSSASPLFFSKIIDSIPVSHSKGLSIEAINKSPTATAGWRLYINNPEIPLGARIDVKVEAMINELSGIGVLLIVKVMSGNPDNPEIASYASNFLTGSNQNFNDLMTTIGYYPSEVQRIEIYLLIQPNTIGTAYFDNLKLIVRE